MHLFALACLAFVAGLVSFTSPCTLPLLPGYLSYVSGLSPAGRRDASDPPRRRVLGGALLFVAGLSTVFTLLGATASGVGAVFARHTVLVDRISGGFIVLMGLATAGVLRIPLPGREFRFGLARIPPGPGGAFPLGAAFAFGWTPCVGPVLAAVLATAADTATVRRGVALLVAYSLGLGLPFLLLAVAVGRGRVRLGWLRRRARGIEVTGGVLLAGMGVMVLLGGWTVLMARVLAVYARLGWPPI